ncbi:hypothetical protein LC087_10285 [Bacillus carboniphilus]|uniref:Uncharacterized protein n=1 Tax=Bacillus carboniphilus TaxID=86663 RepID=A0ABY9JPI6_9BACI|nr:hypothetical protein [Bacillus carboniphilus]WLR41314.1 hypothetical protein LC087_10285 [Bacillus carboniphilus]
MDPSLSSPWMTQSEKIIHTVGDDPLVRIRPLQEITSNLFILRIIVNGEKKAQALDSLITKEYCFSGVRLQVIVEEEFTRKRADQLCVKTALGIAELLVVALETNHLFKTVLLSERFGEVAVFPIISSQIIQFFNDDQSDYYENFNGVAANIFKDVMVDILNGMNINYSTERI